jgi:hypothetical protein
MLRQSEEKSITSPDVINDIISQGTNIGDISLLEYQGQLVPMELKITKAKDGNKNDRKFMIFNPYNLRIYDRLPTVIADMIQFKTNNENLTKDIESIGLIIDSDDNSLFFDDIIDPIDNILL